MRVPIESEFMKQIMKLRTPRGLNKFYPEFYQYLRINYPSLEKITEAAYWYYNNLTEHPICEVCGNLVRFKNFTEGYSRYCCQKCMSRGTRSKAEKTKRDRYGGNGVSPEIVKKRQQTCLKNHGVKHPSQSKEIREKQNRTMIDRYGGIGAQSKMIREKIENTNKKRYGVYHALQNQDILNKSEQTCLKNHGVKHPSQSKEIREKQNRTMIDRYGGVGPQSEVIKEKIKKTNLERYGQEWGIGTEEIREKVKKTNLEKYGVENVFASDKIKEKIKKTNLEKYGVFNPGGIFGGTQGKSYSEVSQRVFRQLDKIFNEYTTQYATKGGEYIVNFQSQTFYIDYFVKELNLCIEFYGDYYHANPLYYSPADRIFEYNQIKACQIWERDRIRIDILKSLGYNVLIIWETEYKNCKNLKKWINELLKK